jgi:hypothetical protein
MKKNVSYLFILFVFLASFSAVYSNGKVPRDKITIDYTMAEKTLDWLDFIKTGASEVEVKRYFMKHVAPTKGCQSIIQHWKRFMEWDEEKIFQFIKQAMIKHPIDQILEYEKKLPYDVGWARYFWVDALEDPDYLRNALFEIKKINVIQKAATLAHTFLPENVKLKNEFYVVLFGASSAYSVGKVNGIDLLQIPLLFDGSIDSEEVITTFAHELHHTGFYYLTNKHMRRVRKKDRLQLIGILASEGMPTFYIDQIDMYTEKYSQSSSRLLQHVALAWNNHKAKLPGLFILAEEDIEANLKGKMDWETIHDNWMHGIKGPAYVLASEMLSVINRFFDLQEILEIVKDYRLFLDYYNRAARLANEQGENHFLFDENLVKKVLKFK